MLNSERCYSVFYRKSTLVHIWILQFCFSTGSRLRRQPRRRPPQQPRQQQQQLALYHTHFFFPKTILDSWEQEKSVSFCGLLDQKHNMTLQQRGKVIWPIHYNTSPRMYYSKYILDSNVSKMTFPLAKLMEPKLQYSLRSYSKPKHTWRSKEKPVYCHPRFFFSMLSLGKQQNFMVSNSAGISCQ